MTQRGIINIFDNNPLLRNIFDQANIGIYFLNEKGLLTYINKYIVFFLGYDKEELLGTTPLDILVPQEREKISRELRNRLSGTPDSASYKTKIINKAGHEVAIRLDVASLRDEGARIIGVIGFVRDITQHVQAHKERKRFEDHTLMIEKLTALGRLATTVVHQINNPLEAIKNYLYLLKDDLPAKDPHRKLITKIEYEVFRIAGLTRQIVEFAVPSSSQFMAYNIRHLLDDTLLLMDKKIRTENVIVKKRIEKSLPLVEAFPDLLKQTFINIIFNALEAMSVGGELSISAECIGNTVEIRFCDNGSGIQQDNLGHIFDPFYSTKDPLQYMGLGLSVSLHIIHNHRGMIRVESELNKGTCVIISLPALLSPTEKNS